MRARSFAPVPPRPAGTGETLSAWLAARGRFVGLAAALSACGSATLERGGAAMAAADPARPQLRSARASEPAAGTRPNEGTDGCATSDPADPFAADKAAILDVMTAFRQSIVEHDLEAMRGLFWNGQIVWVGAGHPDSWAYYQTLNPSIEQVQQGGAYQYLGNPSYRNELEERFLCPTIDTDGQVATVLFDYVFLTDGAASNWGRESWQMVEVGAEWKILHLLYSYNAVEVAPVPDTLR